MAPGRQKSPWKPPKRFRPLRVALAKHIERRVYGRADRIVTLSEAFATEACERYGVSRDKVRVVPGGVDAHPFLAAPARAAARERLGWPVERPIFLSVRRLTRRMGLENLIAAFQIVRGAHPNALLLIGGTGHLATVLHRQIEERGLQDSVRLLGFVPDADLPLAYAAADVTVVPTLALEGFGLVTLESLAGRNACDGNTRWRHTRNSAITRPAPDFRERGAGIYGRRVVCGSGGRAGNA